MVRDLAEAVDPEPVAAPAGAAASAPVAICGTQGRPQAGVVAAEEQVRVVEVREAAAKAPVVARELAAAGADPVEVAEERVSAAQAVPAAELASAVWVGQAMEVMVAELVGPARAAVLAAAGAFLEAKAAVPEAAVPAVVDLEVVDLAVVDLAVVDLAVVDLAVVDLAVVDPAVEVQAEPVEQALAVAARLAAEAQQPSLANGSRPRHLFAAESWVEFPAFPECRAQQARVG